MFLYFAFACVCMCVAIYFVYVCICVCMYVILCIIGGAPSTGSAFCVDPCHVYVAKIDNNNNNKRHREYTIYGEGNVTIFLFNVHRCFITYILLYMLKYTVHIK